MSDQDRTATGTGLFATIFQQNSLAYEQSKPSVRSQRARRPGMASAKKRGSPAPRLRTRGSAATRAPQVHQIVRPNANKVTSYSRPQRG